MTSGESMKQMCLFLLIGVLSLLAMTAFPVPSRAKATEANAAATQSSRLHALRVERRDLLQRMATHAELSLTKGRISAEEAAQAALELGDAELDLCTAPKERVGVLERILEAMRRYEAHEEAFYKTGGVLETAVWRAKATRLKAEIELEQARLEAQR